MGMLMSKNCLEITLAVLWSLNLLTCYPLERSNNVLQHLVTHCIWLVIDKFLAYGRKRWVIQPSLQANAVQLFEQLCRKLNKVNNFSGVLFRVIENSRQHWLRKLIKLPFMQTSRNADLNLSNTRPNHWFGNPKLVPHPQDEGRS